MSDDETSKTIQMSRKLNEYNYLKFRQCQIKKT